MRNQVLIVSCENDVHVDAVVPHLKASGVEHCILVTEHLLDTPLTLRPVERNGNIRCGDLSLRLADVASVWYRKPEPVPVGRFGNYMSADELDFIQAECQEVLDGLYALLADRFWLVVPPLFRLASRKLLELAVARESGFTVPRTIVTNSVDDAAEFCRGVDWQVAIKSLSWAVAMKAEGEATLQYGMYCRKLTKAEAEAGLELVRHAPAVMQQYIEKRSDLRVVAVGRDHVFPVEIASQNGTFSAEDCRFEIRDLAHHLLDMPHLTDPIHRYMDRMQLQFGCFDFAVSKETGEPVFLECNPNGQFLWLEKETGAPISRAIADVLARPVTSFRANDGALEVTANRVGMHGNDQSTSLFQDGPRWGGPMRNSAKKDD